MKTKPFKLAELLIITIILSFISSSIVYSAENKGLTSISFKDADLRDVIKMLSGEGGYNVVVGNDVTGKVTFDLHNVTIQDALDAALKINGYGIEKMGEILFIKPASQLVTQYSPMQPAITPHLQIRSFKLNYINASDITASIKEYSSANGKVTANISNNLIVVEDLVENLNRIETILNNMDVVPKQVLIEAKVLEIRLSDDLQLGVDWNKVVTGGDATYTFQGSNFSNPVTTGAPGLYFNIDTPSFKMFLDTLQQKGDLKTLSTPKLVTLDNKEAQIIIGGRLGYRVTTTSNQVTTEDVEFLEIGTMLKITPRIGNDGNILLAIYPKVSDGVVTQGLPSETTTEVTTNVAVRDGESIFIGGLIRDRKETVDKQIPLLGDIPILGYLFKRKTENLSKTETIVVITPHIVDLRSAEIIQREMDKVNKHNTDPFGPVDNSSVDIK